MWHQYINNTASLVKIETAHCEIYKAAVLSYSHQIPPPRAQLQSHLISPLQLPLFIWILSARQLLQPASGLPEALVFCRILRKCIFNMMKNLQAWLYWFDQLGNCHNNSSIASKKRRDFTKRSCRQFKRTAKQQTMGEKKSIPFFSRWIIASRNHLWRFLSLVRSKSVWNLNCSVTHELQSGTSIPRSSK